MRGAHNLSLGRLPLMPTARVAFKHAEYFENAHTTGVSRQYNPRLPPPSSGQRLASTIARMPARTAAGRFDHASTT